MDLGCRKIGNFEISNICLLSYPCKHHVEDTRTGLTQLMNGPDIYNLIKQHGLTYDHFDRYSDIGDPKISFLPTCGKNEHPYLTVEEKDINRF